MNEIILINKPKGYTSRDIVNIVSKKLNTKKDAKNEGITGKFTESIPDLIDTTNQ